MVTQCPNCKAKFKARDDFKGKVTKCPKCRQPFTVAEFVAEALPAPEPAPAAVQSKPAAPAPQTKPVPVPQSAPQTRPAPAPQPAYRTGHTEQLSDTLYVYSVLCALVLGIFSLFLGQGCLKENDAAFRTFGYVLMPMGAALGIYGTAIVILMYYKMWAAIQDDNARITPGKAVGFLFVPVLNIFWTIYMLMRFAGDYEDFAARNSIRSERLSKGLMLQYGILSVFAAVSFLVLCILPWFGIGDDIFGRVYPTFGHAEGSLRLLVMAWKLSNILITLWLFAIYAIVSSRICRAINAI